MYREYYRNYYRNSYNLQAVETIIIINFIFFLPYIAYFLFRNTLLLKWLYSFCALSINNGINALGVYNVPQVEQGAIWQFITAMFTHGGFFHLFFNMYGLYIFGKPLELLWGAKKFLLYYLITGILANVASYLIFKIMGYSTLLVGASGAIFAVLLAYATYSPDTILLLFFFIPLKVKWAILLYAAIELYAEITNSMGGISHITHLSGFVFGYLYLLIFFKINPIKEMYFSDRNRWV